MRHFQALLRIDTQNPPGNETKAAEYVKQALERDGIPSTIVGSDPNRSNLLARLKGSGRKRPLLIMGHTDVVTVDAAKWKFPPFSATRDGGYVYSRGVVDNKQDVAAGLMTMLRLKREKVALRAHWGDWTALKGKLPKGHARSLVDYLTSHPTDFKGAVARLRPELQGLYLSAYQSFLWNRMLAAWLEREFGPANLAVVELKLGRVPTPVRV